MGYLLTNIARIWETSLQSIGGHFVMGMGGILFLGFPVAFWCGAYGYAIAAHAGLAMLPAISIGIALSAASGALFSFFYSRLSNDSFAVMTLASVFAMEALLRSWDSVTGGVLGIAGVPRLSFAQSLQSLAIVEGCVVVVVLLVSSLLERSSFGRSLRALKENKTLLMAMGTSPNVTGQIALLFACLFLGLAGIFGISRIQFLDPSFGGMFLLVQIMTVTIITNSPKISRFFTMAVVIALLPELLRFFNLPTSILGYARNFLYAFILILLIYYGTYKTSFKRNV
jgi:branched-chain amino acid transport system permease protein